MRRSVAQFLIEEVGIHGVRCGTYKFNYTPLHYAAMEGNASIALKLLQAGEPDLRLKPAENMSHRLGSNHRGGGA